MHLLVETAAGYSLYERLGSDEIAQSDYSDFSRFQRIMRLVSFMPFKSALHALENCNDVSEGIMHPFLKSFLELNLAKNAKAVLGVGESNLGGSIKAETGIECQVNDTSRELIRGIKLHGQKFLSQLKPGDLDRAQLGLGHAYSRSKVKFNVNRVDNMITQSISLLDQLDKDVNTFAMRVREWYGWHFPELIKIITDYSMYAKLVKFIRNKGDLTTEHLEGLEGITGDAVKAQQILDAARASMGTNISEIDMINIQRFADRIISLYAYRTSLFGYLCDKMHAVAPNVSSLIGEMVGARLISHAGSLTNLAKYPASTVQILGAEKALFRALKTRGNTPKYGLIYHSTFIGRAGQKNKGRISRVLANKVSIASRIDCFMDAPSSKFGELLREQVEERLRFYEDGITPRKNADVMEDALKEMAADLGDNDMDIDSPKKRKPEEEKKQKKSKKSKVAEPEAEAAPEVAVETPKKKKSKSSKSESAKKAVEPVAPVVASAEKKKKKKSKKE